MKSYRILSFCMILLIACGFLSCEKFLDAKPDDRLAVPSTITDLQLLLDDYNTLNTQYPYAQELAADNFYLTTDDWNTLSQLDRDIYNWQKDDQTLDRWTAAYQAVLNTNIVLDNIGGVQHSVSEQAAWNNVKGSALFFRAFYFYGIAQVFTLPYNKSNPSANPGIPLRLNADYTEVSVRASQEETYQQIITDLQQAISLLPVIPAIKSRPCKPAAYGLLARVYLDMQEYAQAGAYADSCLQLYNRLIDYNTLDPAADVPIMRFSDEVIFEALAPVFDIATSLCRIDTLLYAAYTGNDLRRQIYFSNNTGFIVFKGDYSGLGTTVSNINIFTGIVTDEMYLVKAECNARAANTAAAMQALNALLLTRWKTGTFVPLTATGPADALQKILTERRKELLFRGARWSDLRRLKDDPQFSVTPVRILDGQRYELTPNSPRYALQLPRSVIEKTGMPQNP
ncbi:MAG TPA: RagB/SusD family nutrient uptake outer membrane protein [Chitinophaga sp.]